MENQTVEKKAATKNGVSRMIFVMLSILLEAALIILMFTSLNKYAEWINIFTRILGLLLVLWIYVDHKTSSLKTPWIMLILSFPIFGVILFLLIGLNGSTRRMSQRYQKIDEMLLPMLPDHEKLLDEMAAKDENAAGIAGYIRKKAGYPVYQNTDVEYYDDAAKGLEAQLHDLAKAEKFIFMEYHAIEDKESWQRVQKVLEARVKAGVEVRVFYDDMGSIGFINTDFVKKMQEAGIHCRVFNPFVPGLNLFLNNRDHRKITVVDGKVGYTGGYNLANEYFNLTHPYGQWKDTGIRIEGEAVRSLSVTFLEMWNAVKEKDKNDTDFESYLPKTDYTAREQGFIQPYADSPMDEEQVGENVYISMANKANRYCYFVTPYLIITDEMNHALGLAAKRGVDVRIITPGIPDKKIVYGVTRSFYNGLVRNGVRIFEWTPGFCHAKMSIADDKMATCGTINLDYRSLYHHFENGCFFYDCKAVADIKADFDSMFPQCREVTEQYKTGRSAVMRMGQLFLRLFAGLL
ncbi:MAG: cardiolipin synthase [Lachnospiraceae bacterium]|nr:cardiolipin synthase [Lachnospiraceae bacterium]